MRIQSAFRQNKVARRLFMLFVLSAIFPVIVIVLLALGHLGGLLKQIGYHELTNSSKSYGMSVFERLRTLEGSVAALANEMTGKTGRFVPELTRVAARLHFRSLRIARLDRLGFVSADMHRRVESGTVVVAVVPDGSTGARVLMLRQLPSRQDVVVAEPDTNFLWGERENLPYLTNICVVEAEGRTLYCSHPLTEYARVAQQNRGRKHQFEWRDNGEDFVGASWMLFLDGRFGTPGWTVIASRPKEALLAPLEQFWVVILPALVVSLLFVVLLTVIHVRRWLVPLELLIQATRRIGGRDFSPKVSVNTGDEFEELGHALNSMATRLGRQFSALKTWSEVDRVILSDPDIDRVLEIMLNRLPDLVPADVPSILVLEDPRLALGRIHFRPARQDARVAVERVELSEADIGWLTEQVSGELVSLQAPLPAFLGTLSRLGAVSASMLPVVLKGSVVGVIGLGYKRECSLSDEDRDHIRHVADRVAVALSAADREIQLFRQAHYDPLTTLPNRLYLEDRLKQEIAHAQRDGQRLALLFIDLDRFKDVNDILGHAAGDNLLRLVADRLRACVREGDTVARLGGDEFTMLLRDIDSARGAQVVAKKVIKAVSEPILINGRETFASCSIGVTVYPDDAQNGEELLRKADTAMYRAKQNGRRCYVFFEERMNVEALSRIALEQDLRRALQRDEFVLHFQPQVDLRSGAVVGAEVLVRWAHATRGLLTSNQFITVAENAGLIESIGEHLLRKACAQYGTWLREGIAPSRLAVNVSARQLRQRNFCDLVQSALAEADMPAAHLELEITESLLLADAPEVVANFSRLEALGVTLAIDDFGTGYSSLSYIKRLPVDAIKIDRTFIRDVPASDDACTLVNTVISMARSLRKEVIAEGVETDAQVQFLLESGCHIAQGFAISMPLDANDFAAYMRARQQAPTGSP